jgi:hypothetical protein
MPRNLFRMSLKELREWQKFLHSLPGYHYTGEDLSADGLAEKMEVDHTVMARDYPCPIEGSIEPGALVYFEYEGLPAKWLQGTVYVANRHLKKEE